MIDQPPPPPVPFVVKTVDFVISAASARQYVDDGLPQIAFAGRSNVGKSTLLNTLANRRQLARVSSTPGRTRLVNYFLVNKALHFVDLPGYGFAKAPREMRAGWEKLITRYIEGNSALRAVVALFDIRREHGGEDLALLEWLGHNGVPIIAVLTKADKLSRSQQREALRRFNDFVGPFAPLGVSLFSSTTREGRDELLALIGQAAASGGPDPDGSAG